MKPICVLLVALAFFAIEVNCAAPRDLESEISQKLEQLRTTVQGAINKGIKDVDDFVTGLYRYREDALQNAIQSITQDYQVLNNLLDQLKEAANTKRKDPGPCLKFREDLFHRLPREAIESLNNCIADINAQLTVINNDARYGIGILIDEVGAFDFQIEQCQGARSCLLPIVNQIELASIKIPQTIEVEVQNAEQLLARLKLTAVECVNSKASEYQTEGTGLFEAISTCVDSWPSQ